MSYTPDAVAYLAAHQEDIAQVASTLDLRPGAAIATASALEKHFGDYSRPVHELLSARAKSAGKLPQDWLMCTDSAQQATPQAVANLRAARIHRTRPDATVHDVTCSIGTDAAALVAQGQCVIASDLDASRAAMAHYNLHHTATHHAGTPRPGSFLVAQADALHPTSRAEVIIADPARRAGGRRIARPEDLIPPLPDLIATYPGRDMAIKCAPGLDYSAWEGLVSLVSVDGGVKEACLYTPGMSEGITREAVVIRTDFTDRTTDACDNNCPVTPPRRYLIDPDGAIVRAGLVTHFATRFGLSQLDERIAYLTGDDIPPGYSGFEILDVTSPKKVKAAVKAHQFGRLEILLRGIDGDPDALRKSYKPKGPHAGTIVLTRIGRDGVALICGPRQHQPHHPGQAQQ